MSPPRRRETDFRFSAKIKEWSGVIASVSAVLTFLAVIFVSLGGQYVMPNDRVARLEARVESNAARIETLEDRVGANNRVLLDSITKMNAGIQSKIDLLTVSRCMEANVRPPRLRKVCDDLADALPFRP